MRRFIFLSLFIITQAALALDCTKEHESLTTLHGGRVKTLLITARTVVKELTGKYSYQDQTALETFCHLNMNSELSEFFIPVEHGELKSFLGLTESKIDINKAIERQEDIKVEIIRQKQNNSYKKALDKLWYRMDNYLKLKDGNLLFLPDPSDTSKFKSYKELYGKEKPSFANLKNVDEKYLNDHSSSFLLENKLVKQRVFSMAMLMGIISIFLVVLLKSSLIGGIAIALTIAIQIYGIVLRVLISGRAPITNMYETVLFSGLGALVLAFIIYFFKREKIYLLGGLGYNILCLFMMKFSYGMLNGDISPLVPVLRDNFWLSTHVTTIMLSYAALALSWMMANITLFKQRFLGIDKKEYRYYESLIYTSIKVGIVLLSAGIILGGVWADYSWGRFWGWDPKETWSLIVLLFYMALLHGKGTSWINTHRFILSSAFGFLTVMMAWFGVNYILASGLHSYGFSEGGAIFLGSFFLVQILFLALTFKNKVTSGSST